MRPLYTKYKYPQSTDKARNQRDNKTYKSSGWLQFLKEMVSAWRLNSQLCHAGLDPVSSAFLDSRLRGNDGRRVINRRSNIKKVLVPE